MTCTTSSCKPYSIKVSAPLNHLTDITLIEGITVTSKFAYLARGECTRCYTFYHPDHENYSVNGKNQEVFINSAQYLKIGANTWVDRVFSNAVFGGMYNFHASANAYMQYWNECFGTSITLSQRQIWQAFTQESIRAIAEASGVDFEAEREMDIENVSLILYLRFSIISQTQFSLLIWHSKPWKIKVACLWLKTILVLSAQNHESHNQVSQILQMQFLVKWL